MVKSSPGVSPNPRFGPNLDSMESTFRGSIFNLVQLGVNSKVQMEALGCCRS